MKKLLLLFLSMTMLFASSADEFKAKLIEYIALNLTQHKDVVKVYVDHIVTKNVKQLLKKVKLVEDCQEADVIFVKKLHMLPKKCNKKIVFVTSYIDYKKNKDAIIGAFFWQKGRPNIIFNAKKISQLQIELPKEFEKYME